VDPRSKLEATLVGLIDLLAGVDEYREMLDAHVVVAGLAAIGRP
jgi:hypothetical protein